MDADVIVIGAGAAGLAAARRLAERSLRVRVIEARDRVGGRAWSCRIGSASILAELGAEFIHGHAMETMALLREAGSAAIDTGGESWTYSDGELRQSEDDFAEAATMFKEAVSLEHDESVDRFLQRFEHDARLRDAAEAARAFAEGFDAADPTTASARSIGEEWQSGVDSISARPLGGYRAMFDRLRSACESAGARIELRTRARRIRWRSGAVMIDVPEGTSSRTIQARAAIVTVPVGVLRHTGDDSAISFEPALPSAKRAALLRLEMGHAVKVTLSFRTPFWERLCDGRYRDAGFFRSAGAPFAVYWTQLPVRSELIVAWRGGPQAAALGALPRNDLIDRAVAGFGALFGETQRARDQFEGAVVHDWGTDLFARGAYSYVAVDGGGARAALAAPVEDTLFFAGEATAADGQGGTVNGALASGERAAREAATELQVLSE